MPRWYLLGACSAIRAQLCGPVVVSWFLLGTLPGLAGTLLLGYGKRLLDRRSNRRRWLLNDPLRVCISASPSVKTDAYSRPTTGIGQAKALAQIAPPLTKAWQNVDFQSVYFVDEIPGNALETDLILIDSLFFRVRTLSALSRLPGLWRPRRFRPNAAASGLW